MKFTITTVIFFAGIILKSHAQYTTVCDTSFVYENIKSHFKKDLKDTAGFTIGIIQHRNLIDSANLEFGVFAFIKLSTEPGPFLYFRNYNEHKITIVTDYHMDSVLKRLSDFFELNKNQYKYYQRVVCTKRVLEVLERRLN